MPLLTDTVWQGLASALNSEIGQAAQFAVPLAFGIHCAYVGWRMLKKMIDVDNGNNLGSYFSSGEEYLAYCEDRGIDADMGAYLEVADEDEVREMFDDGEFDLTDEDLEDD